VVQTRQEPAGADEGRHLDKIHGAGETHGLKQNVLLDWLSRNHSHWRNLHSPHEWFDDTVADTGIFRPEGLGLVIFWRHLWPVNICAEWESKFDGCKCRGL